MRRWLLTLTAGWAAILILALFWFMLLSEGSAWGLWCVAAAFGWLVAASYDALTRR